MGMKGRTAFGNFEEEMRQGLGSLFCYLVQVVSAYLGHIFSVSRRWKAKRKFWVDICLKSTGQKKQCRPSLLFFCVYFNLIK